MTGTIKLVVFDLDGVLVESKDLHYVALNRSIEEVDSKYSISRDEHLNVYDGLSTKQKLHILTREKGLPEEAHGQIYSRKQYHTQQYLLSEIRIEEYDQVIRGMLRDLSEKGYIVYCASNAIYNTVKLFLSKKGFLDYIDYFISNEDVNHPKPHPEIYMRCMLRAGVGPRETLVIEDSPIGRQSALDSGSHLLPVDSPRDLNTAKVLKAISKFDIMEKATGSNSQKWPGKVNVVIPMAGAGSRFAKVGYTFPKPLIDVRGKPMIQVVVDNLNLGDGAQFHFIVQKSHYEKYALESLLNRIAPGCNIIQVEGVTEGAACSVLLAREFIDNDEPMLMANSDQFVEWDSNRFFYKMTTEGADGGILTFQSNHPKWSYADVDVNGCVTRVAEKDPISDHATVGIYYWKRGSDFVKYTDQMIAKEIRVNGEFYVCPVFNEAVGDDRTILINDCERMWGIGVPEDLRYFLENYDGEL